MPQDSCFPHLSASPKIELIRLHISPLMATCITNVEFGYVFSIKYIIYYKGDPGCGEDTGERQMRVMGKQRMKVKRLWKQSVFQVSQERGYTETFPSIQGEGSKEHMERTTVRKSTIRNTLWEGSDTWWVRNSVNDSSLCLTKNLDACSDSLTYTLFLKPGIRTMPISQKKQFRYSTAIKAIFWVELSPPGRKRWLLKLGKWVQLAVLRKN